MECYICNICGKVIEDLPTYEDSHYTCGGEYLGTESGCDTDCSCGGTFVVAKECPICGDCYIEEDNDLCDDCFDVWATQENALEMGNDEPTEIEINGFWASVFTDREIEEVLEREFKSLNEYDQKKYIHKYCAEDKYYFREWLEEKFRNANIH